MGLRLILVVQIVVCEVVVFQFPFLSQPKVLPLSSQFGSVLQQVSGQRIHDTEEGFCQTLAVDFLFFPQKRIVLTLQLTLSVPLV